MHQETLQLIQILEKTVSPGKFLEKNQNVMSCHCTYRLVRFNEMHHTCFIK